MSRVVRRLAIAGAGVLLSLGAVGATAVATAETAPPTGQIGAVHATAGRLQFVLSARDLPAGAHLDPASIHVAVAGRTLPASAQLQGARNSSTGAPEQTAMLVLDTSGSMRGAGLAGARQAAAQYARGVPDTVRVGLVTFATKPTLAVAPPTDRAALSAALSQVRAGGNTAVYDGIARALQAMSTMSSPGAERRLVVLSDGNDTASGIKLPALLTMLARAHVRTDVVAFRLGAGDQRVQRQIAAAAGGQVLTATDIAGLTAAFSAAASTFTERANVTVDVPSDLAGKQATINASMTADNRSISVTSVVRFAGVAAPPAARTSTVPKAAPAPNAAAPANRPAAAPVKHGIGFWLVLALTFCALLSIFALVCWRPAHGERERIAAVQRYRVLPAAEAEQPRRATEGSLTKAALALVDKLMRVRGMRERIVVTLERAGVRMRPAEWVLLQTSAGVVLAAVLILLTGTALLGIPLGAFVAWLGSRVYLGIKTSRRVAAFADQLPDVLQMVAGSLRSGFSLSQALDGVVKEGAEPAASEFARALAESRLGADLEDSLNGVAHRMKCRDLSWVVMAVRISREVGGNLAEVILTTVETMRERAQMRRQVRTLSAEGRLSAYILIGLPIVLGGWFLLVRRDYLRPLFTTPIGIAMLAGAVLLVAIGAYWMNRLVKVEV